MALAASFTVLPFVGFLLSGNPNAFRMMAVPGGLAFFIVPALIYLPDPGKPALVSAPRPNRERAVDTVNRDHPPRRQSRAADSTVAALGDHTPRCARTASALSGVVRSRPTAVDGNRHF